MNDYAFQGKDGCNYVVSLLTERIAKEHAARIKNLLDDIKGAESSYEFITGSRYDGRLFKHKWELSYFCADSRGAMVGIAISHFHLSDGTNPFDSVYIHRVAVAPEHRRNYVAFNILKIAITNYFAMLPWLRNISAQVTTQPHNIVAESLYKKLGFYSFGSRLYPEKTDSILVLHRFGWAQSSEGNNIVYNELEIFPNPRFEPQSNLTCSLVFYVSSGSREKRQQLSWLLSLYNVKTIFYSPPVELIEPQVDSMDAESEILLVSHPLKQIARFIGNNKTPFLIEDTMLFIERFNRDFDRNPELPGLDTKRWWRQLGNEGVLQLLADSSKRRAKYVSQVGCYLGNGRYFYGRGELEGRISSGEKWNRKSEQDFPLTNPLFFHKIFIPEGLDKTLAELNGQEFTYCDYRRKAIEDLLAKLTGEQILSPLQHSFEFGDGEDAR